MNIQLGFRKAGLVLFNSEKAIGRLHVSLLPTPSPPRVATLAAPNYSLQTIKNSRELQEVSKLLEDLGSVVIQAAKEFLEQLYFSELKHLLLRLTALSFERKYKV